MGGNNKVYGGIKVAKRKVTLEFVINVTPDQAETLASSPGDLVSTAQLQGSKVQVTIVPATKKE